LAVFSKIQDFTIKNETDFALFQTPREQLTKGAAAKSKHKQSDIEEILPQLISWRKDIIDLYIDSQKKEKILEAILPLKVNDIQKKLCGNRGRERFGFAFEI
jgi:hypothetical protein